MKKLLTILLCVGMALMFTSCATIIDGTSETISVDSNVKGAKVYIDNSYVGDTPYVGTISKAKESKTIKVSKTGYEDSITILNPTYNNVALLSGVGFLSTTDYETGAMWKYDPAAFYVTLTKNAE